MRLKLLLTLIVLYVFTPWAFYSCSNSKNSKSSGAGEPGAQLQIRVMSYNIHHANPPGTDTIDLDAIADIIRESGADLVALQELDSVTERANRVYQLEYLAWQLNMNYHFFKAIPFGGGSYGVGVISKFPMDQARTIRLPKRNDIKSEDRIIGMVRVKLPGKDSVWFGSTHWDVVSEENRILQAEKACEELRQLNHPVILAGDLNTRKMSPSIAVLKSAFTLASKDFAPTIPSDQPDRRIDYVVYAKDRDFSLIREEVLFNSQTQKASDHLPVVADLQAN